MAKTFECQGCLKHLKEAEGKFELCWDCRTSQAIRDKAAKDWRAYRAKHRLSHAPLMTA